MLAAANAGRRIVAVGDYGIVLLSDDDGRTFRQATHSPTRVTLNAVFFANEHEGWIVGHWGVVLHSIDGGESWELQRSDTSVDQPLFTVWFSDAQNGLASGLWSLMLATHDGGKSWIPLALPPPPGSKKADKNLYQIVPGQGGLLIVAAEQGLTYRSTDGGTSWQAIPTGSPGSFWTGAVLGDGTFVLAGLRGQISRSTDSGMTWTPIASGTHSSIVHLEDAGDGSLLGVGLDGVTVASRDRGASFSVRQRDDRLSFTAMIVNRASKPVLFSKAGLVVSGTNEVAAQTGRCGRNDTVRRCVH